MCRVRHSCSQQHSQLRRRRQWWWGGGGGKCQSGEQNPRQLRWRWWQLDDSLLKVSKAQRQNRKEACTAEATWIERTVCTGVLQRTLGRVNIIVIASSELAVLWALLVSCALRTLIYSSTEPKVTEPKDKSEESNCCKHGGPTDSVERVIASGHTGIRRKLVAGFLTDCIHLLLVLFLWQKRPHRWPFSFFNCWTTKANRVAFLVWNRNKNKKKTVIQPTVLFKPLVHARWPICNTFNDRETNSSLDRRELSHPVTLRNSQRERDEIKRKLQWPERSITTNCAPITWLTVCSWG